MVSELNANLKVASSENLSLTREINELNTKHEEEIKSITEQKSKLVCIKIFVALIKF